jgi:TRAP-type C4-dicarboxylate transport system substrate-binding protein
MRVFAAFATLLAATTARAEEFLSSDLLGSHSPAAQAVVYMGKVLRERIDDRHSIRVPAQVTVSADNYTIEQVRSGALVLARVRFASFRNIVPLTVVPALPYLFKSTAHLRRSLDGPIGDEIPTAMESNGFIGLGFYDTGPRSFQSSKKPTSNAAELKDLRVHVQSSDILASLLKAIGTTPTPVPFSKLYNALGSNAVDAAEVDLPTYEDSGHHEVAKYCSLTEHSRAPQHARLYLQREFQ